MVAQNHRRLKHRWDMRTKPCSSPVCSRRALPKHVPWKIRVALAARTSCGKVTHASCKLPQSHDAWCILVFARPVCSSRQDWHVGIETTPAQTPDIQAFPRPSHPKRQTKELRDGLNFEASSRIETSGPDAHRHVLGHALSRACQGPRMEPKGNACQELKGNSSSSMPPRAVSSKKRKTKK